MRILKIAADFMDSAMNNERLNMGEVVGEMMEPFLIQISHWLVKPFNLTYWGCLYLKKWRNYSIFCKCIENWQFSKFQTIFKGGTLGKKLFFQFFKILLFHFGISYGPIIKQCKDIRMLKKHILTWCYTIVVVTSNDNHCIVVMLPVSYLYLPLPKLDWFKGKNYTEVILMPSGWLHTIIIT